MFSTNFYSKRKKLQSALLAFIMTYALVPAFLLVVITGYVNYQQQNEAVVSCAEAYYNNMLNVCEQHVENLSNITTILQDCEPIRTRLTAQDSADFSGESISIYDVITSPQTYMNYLNNFSINAISIFSQDQLCYYSLSAAGVDLPLERMANIYQTIKDADFVDGRFITVSEPQSAYAYYVKDYKNIYNGRYYGKIIIEVSPIASNLLESETIYLPASNHSLDLETYPSVCYYLYDETDTVIFSSNSSCVGNRLTDVCPSFSDHKGDGLFQEAGGTLSYQSDLSSCDLFLYSTASQSDFSPYRSSFPTAFALVLFLLYILILILGFRNFYAPFVQLEAYCQAAVQYDRPLPPTFSPSFEELSDVSKVFSQNVSQYEILERRCSEAESEIQKKQLQLLQSQMDPHFLFNMLDIIGWKAEEEHSDDIRIMVDQLGDILHYAIRPNQSKISIRDEITYIQQYLSLRQLNSHNKFQYTVNVDPDLLDQYYIPKMILQPLVENSILHGILPSDRTGTIQIDIWEDMEGIMCRVRDNGVGFDSDLLARPDGSSRHNHIALKNIRKRLDILYGAPYGLTIHSIPGAGTIATIYIPFDPILPDGGETIV